MVKKRGRLLAICPVVKAPSGQGEKVAPWLTQHTHTHTQIYHHFLFTLFNLCSKMPYNMFLEIGLQKLYDTGDMILCAKIETLHIYKCFLWFVTVNWKHIIIIKICIYLEIPIFDQAHLLPNQTVYSTYSTLTFVICDHVRFSFLWRFNTFNGLIELNFLAETTLLLLNVTFNLNHIGLNLWQTVQNIVGNFAHIL